MAYKLEVNHPDFPKDWEFDLDGVLIKNGHSKTLTEADERTIFGRSGGLTVKELYGKSEVVKISGTAEVKKMDGGE